ncbi:MAG: hypothetical protein FWD58_03200 [Firmicutes bacterium]|nr:hypothetical protein [Bacillota bacterium]
MKSRRSQKIAVAATGAALAAVLILFTRWLPLTFSLLTFAAVAYYIVFEKAGIVHGLLCIAVASALSFIMGSSAGAFFNLFLFAPYSVLAYFMRRVRYDKVMTSALRGAAMAAFFSLVFMVVFFTADILFKELPISDFIGRFSGGYAAVAVLVALAGIVIDVFFAWGSKYLCEKIRLGGKK